MNPITLSVWQVVLAIISIVVTAIFSSLGLFIAYKSHKRKSQKELSITIFEPLLISSPVLDAKNILGVINKSTGEVLESAYLIRYEFENIGIGAIKNPKHFTEFEQPIHLPYDNSLQVVGKFISKMYPANLDIKVNDHDHKIVLSPFLLNEGHSFQLSLVATDTKIENPIFLIEDVNPSLQLTREIMRQKRKKLFIFTRIGVLFVTVLTIVIGFGLFYYTYSINEPLLGLFIAMLLAIFGFAVMILMVQLNGYVLKSST